MCVYSGGNELFCVFWEHFDWFHCIRDLIFLQGRQDQISSLPLGYLENANNFNIKT